MLSLIGSGLAAALLAAMAVVRISLRLESSNDVGVDFGCA
jgi:hypothetical protein